MNYLGQSLSWRENFPLLQIVKQLTLEEGRSIIFVTFHIISAYVSNVLNFTQFSSKVIGTDTNGKLLIVDLDDKNLIGKNFAEKVLFGIIHWFFHMVSDMAGSKSTAGKGTGIPGTDFYH